MALLKTGVDYYLVYKFIRALTTPFDKTKAFEMGIIDAEGNFLKKYKELKTKTEKEAYSAYNRMVWNLRKLIEKVPIIGKALTSWAGMAYLLMKENFNSENKANKLIDLVITHRGKLKNSNLRKEKFNFKTYEIEI